MMKILLANEKIINISNAEQENGVLSLTTSENTVEELAELFENNENTNHIVLLTEANVEARFWNGFTSFIGIKYQTDGSKTIELMQPISETEKKVADLEGKTTKALIEVDGVVEVLNTMFGEGNTQAQAAEQTKRALQFFAQTVTDEQAMEIPTIYPEYEIGKKYEANEIFIYGKNSVGDPQLIRVAQGHTSQKDWLPTSTPSLYTLIGISESGYPIWSRPTGAHDAYNIGDIMYFDGMLYISTIDGNVWSPVENPTSWEVYNG